MKKFYFLLFIITVIFNINFSYSQVVARFEMGNPPIPNDETLYLCFNDTIDFFDNCLPTGGTKAYSWDFGTDASFPSGADTLANPTDITWTSPGIKIVTLTFESLSFPTGTDVTQGIVVVNSNSDVTGATIMSSATDICPGNEVSMWISGGTLGSNAEWKWSKDSINASPFASGETITVSPYDTTEYFAKAVGCDTLPLSSSHFINVYELPESPVGIFANDTVICPLTAVTLTVEGGSLGFNGDWVWYKDSTTGPNIQLDPSRNLVLNPGPDTTTTYFVRAESHCGTTTFRSFKLQVLETSSAPSTITASSTFICPGEQVTLKVADGILGTEANWHWYKDECGISANAIGTGDSIIVSPYDTTTYFVQAINECNTTTCANIVINTKAVSESPNSINVSPSTICIGDSATLTINGGLLGTSAQWNWYSGSCGSVVIASDTNLIKVSPTDTTEYFVRAEGGCLQTNCVNKFVYVRDTSTAPTQIVSPNNPANDPICFGDSIILKVNDGKLAVDANWHWYKNGCGAENSGLSVGIGDSVIATPLDTAEYYVRAEGICNTTTCANIEVTVHDQSEPPTGITANNTLICKKDTVWLEALGGNLGYNANWIWRKDSIDGAFTAQNSSQTIWDLPDSTTTYYVAIGGTCDTTAYASILIEVAVQSIPPDSIFATNSTICQGENDTLHLAGGSLGTYGQWKWYEESCSGNVLGSDTMLIVSPTDTTNYIIASEDFCGLNCYDTINTTINVNPKPALPFPPSIIGANIVCQGDTVPYYVNPFSYTDTIIWSLPSISEYQADTIYGDSINIDYSISAKSDSIYVYGKNSCGFSDSIGLHIHIDTIAKNPYFEFPDNDTVFFENEGAAQVSLVSPDFSVNGSHYFYGNGVVTQTNNIIKFYPEVAGAGEHLMTFEFETPAGCSSSYEKNISVRKANGYFQNLYPGYCYYDNDTSIIAKLPDSTTVIPESKTYILDTANSWGLGIIDTIGDSAVYSPAAIYARFNQDADTLVSDTVVFRYLDGTDTLLIKQVVKIDVFPNARILNLASEYCRTKGEVISLDVIPNEPLGYFTGNGIVGSTNKYDPELSAQDGIFFDTVDYYYTSLEAGVGCTDTHTNYVTIHDSLRFNLIYDSIGYGLGQSICANGGTTRVFCEPSGGIFESTSINIDPLGYFTPNASVVGTKQFTYKITYQGQCYDDTVGEFHIMPTPNLSIDGINSDKKYCKNSEPFELIGEKDDDPSSSGYFWLMKEENETLTEIDGIIDVDTTDGLAILYPDVTHASLGGTLECLVFFSMIDDNGCIDTAFEEITVNDLPFVEITDLDNPYCDNNDPNEKITLNKVVEPGTGEGYFSLNGDSLSSEFEIPMDSIHTGYHLVTFTYKKGSTGCTNIDSVTLNIRPMPSPEIRTGNLCIADSIRFEGIVIMEDSVFNDPIDQWIWDFNDGGSAQGQIVKHKFENAGRKQVELYVSTPFCNNSIEDTLDLDTIPPVSFAWNYECFGISPTEFYATSLNDTSNIEYTWYFGDGDSISGNHEVDSVIHAYSAPGDYNVSLKIQTSEECSDTEAKTVHIRPYLSSFPYLETFEENSGGWYPDRPDSAIFNTWEYGTEESETNNIIATNLDGDYERREYSAMVSPCFDMRGLEKPIIRFKMKFESETPEDGMRLEASTNNGKSYEPIGGIGSGINWYNNNISEINKGWGGEMNNFQWFEVKHKLDAVRTSPNVRYRFVFRSDGENQARGAYIDSIYIGERSRMVLMEHFTNMNATNSAATRDSLDFLMFQKGLDAVDIQYHTSFPGYDDFYSYYPAGPNTRVNYYSISEVPHTILDGIQRIVSLDEHQYSIDRRALEDPKFHLGIEKSISGNSVNISVEVQAKENIPESDLNVQVALVERNVNLNNVIYKSVLRKFLPGPSGTYFDRSWSIGDIETLNLSSPLDGIDAEQLRVVAFIQDIDSKEVFQAATTDTVYDQTDIKENIFGNANKQEFIVYPNPASKFINILFNLEIDETLYYTIYNSFGTKINEGIFEYGTTKKRIELKNIQTGVYYIKVFNDSLPIGTSKFVVKSK